MAVRRKVTLTDVASRAGVSATTASYILNGRSTEMRISADAEARVRQAAADLRYRPNRSARVLRRDTSRDASRTIAVVSDHLAGGAFASQMLDGARAEAGRRDHLLIMGETGGQPGLAERIVEEMLDRQVDGLVYATLSTGSVSVPAALRQVPSVLLNCVDPVADLRAVLPDELAGGRAAARLVLAAVAGPGRPGPSRPAGSDGARGGVWVLGDDRDYTALAAPLRQVGLSQGLQDAGVAITGAVDCHWDVGPAFQALTEALRASAPPDVLVCLNDRIAMGAYQALAEHGLAVPGDVGVVSFDGSELATWLRPPLTTVAIPYAEMGALAVRVLLDPDGVPADEHGVTRVAMPVHEGGSVAGVGSAVGVGLPRCGGPHRLQ